MLGAFAYFAQKQKQRDELEKANTEKETTSSKPAEVSLGDILDLDEIHLEFAPNIIPLCLDASSGLDKRISKIRRYVAGEFGFIVPATRLTDNAALSDNEYAIRIHGVEAARSWLDPKGVMVLTREDTPLHIPGKDVTEPVYQAPARWIPAGESEAAVVLGLPVIEPVEVIATHLLEVIKGNFGRLMTRRALRRVLDEFVSTSDSDKAAANKKILDEFITDETPYDLIQAVLRLLLEERVSIRNLPVILEAISEARSVLSTPEQIAEYVRQRIGLQLTAKLRNDEGYLPLIQLAPEWEELFTQHEHRQDNGVSDIALAPKDFNRLASSIRDSIANAVSKRRFSRDCHERATAAFSDDRSFGERHSQPSHFLRRDRFHRASVNTRRRIARRNGFFPTRRADTTS